MFRCEGGCGRVPQPGEKPVRVVVETRAKEYPARYGEPRGYNREVPVLDPGGVGWEIAKEINLCPRCAKERAKAETA